MTIMASSSSTMNATDASSTMNYGLISGAVVDVGEAPTRTQQSNTTQQQLLTTVFEQYAQQHPNPKLAAEYEQRNALLQQVAKQQQGSVPLKRKKSLFGLFFKKARHDDTDGLYDTSTLHPDEWLEYESDEIPQQPQDDLLLCDSTLDTSCIPFEAFCMARFLLSCRRDVPNVARNTTKAGIIMTVINVGVICCMSEQGENTVMETSDAPALQAQIPSDYDISRARAVVLSHDVLAVSWGLSDGMVVLYQCNIQHSTWDSVAVISPTRAVSDNLEHHNGNALIVTNVVPLRVKDPSISGGIVTTLAISRLGGYIEFLILPELPKRRTAKRKKRGRPDEHYAANLPNISYSDTSMTALTTADYHVDVLCLESFRTTVGSDTEWDTDLFPKTPPAEHVLVASGGTKEGEQVISYWGVSIVFPENIGQERASIHVSFLDGINMGTVGVDVAVFASVKMWNYWRRPRRVRLRTRQESVDDEAIEQDDADGADEEMKPLTLLEDKIESKSSPLSTLSTPMPIVRMRLTTTNVSKQEVVLAALDGSGGIRFIDSTAVIALAAHDVAEEELGDDSLLNLKCILPSKCLSSVVDIGWLSNDTNGEEGAATSPLLTVIRPCMLQVAALPSSSQLGTSDTIARVSYSLDIPSLTYGATAIDSSSNQCVSFVAFKLTESRRKLLCRENLERLDSSTVIEMLVKISKYNEAIAAAKAMNVPDSTDAIQFCHRKLWELDGDVKHLSQVSDADYAVNETLAIFDCEKQRKGLDLAAARAACLLALERATSLIERKEELVRRLEVIEAKVSTYILLCMSKDAVPQLSRFKEKFLPVPLRHLASAFASNGDISSLTTILFRHRPELLPCQLEIIHKLPLEAPPESFAHLLPVSRSGRTCFHTGEHGVDGMREWPLMAHYMENTYGVRLVLDDKDEAVVLDRCRHFDDEFNTLQDEAIQEWYLTRVKRVQDDVGSISLARDFLQVASQRLNCSFASSSPTDDLDPGLRELCSINTYVMQLDQLCAGLSSTFESGKLIANALATMSLSEIGEMSVDDRVSLILGPSSDPSVVISKFRNGSMFLALGEQSDEQRERMIDSSVIIYCGNAIMNSVGENTTSAEPQQVIALRNALDVCTEIANASRTTIRRSNRIVKDKCTLMNLVLGAAYGTSRACKNIDLPSSDCRHMVESIWESYECLPARSSPSDEVMQSEIQDRVDCLYKNLVVVDVLSRWSSAALGFLGDLNPTGSGEQGRVGKTEVGLVVITEICRSFCSRIQGGASVGAELDLLRDLLSDIDLVNKVGFDGTLSLALTVQEYLIKPLLQHQVFQLIDPLANWMSRDEVRATVLEFVNEAMFDNDGAGGDRVQAAIRCQDILGPLFPELQTEFESSRRYLDAAFFINRMNVGSNKITYPCEVRETLPLDMIESVLKDNPGCILDGCREWKDPSFSSNANEAICFHYWSAQQANAEDSSPRNGEKLPVLPGSAIYHLASLLGLQGSHPLLVVKSRVVYYAVGLSEFAAAAAVCATMVNENGSSWNEKAVADCIVDSVARVVSLNDYGDIRMKLTLCNTVFGKCHSDLSVLDIHSYETVLDSFVMLENMTSRHRQLQQSPASSPNSKAGRTQDNMESAVNDFLVFRAVGMVAKTARNVARHSNQPSDQLVSLEVPPPSLSVHHRVYQDILTQYNTDIRDLFWTLRGVSASNKVDDPLLLTLGRLIGFSSIAEALRIRPQSEPLELERSDLDNVLSLGTSLLLHAHDREALISCIAELKGILARETAATMERAASAAQPDSVVPDPAIVAALVSRGYSENGARRAAVMTANEGAQVALVWAVSHTLDEGFDDPMVNVASHNAFSASGRVDQNMIHCMQETLNLANSYFLRKCTLQSLLPATTTLSNLLESKEVAHNGHGKHSGNIPSGRTEKISKSNTTTTKSSGREVARAFDASAAPAAKPVVLGSNQTRATQSRTPKPDLSVPSTVSKPPPPPPPPEENLSDAAPRRPSPKFNAAPHAASKPPAPSKPAEPKLSVPHPTRAAPHSLSTPTVPKAPSVDRLSTSRSHDQTKTTGDNLASEERKRLIAEGRRMLREARASKATASSTTTSVPAPTNRYPLRSRTPPLPETSSTVPSTNSETPTRPPPSPPSNAKEGDGSDSDGSGWDFDDF